MKYDAKVPLDLKKTQEWFASIITRPIDENSRMNPLSPKGVLMEEEACDFISPSPTLRPAERIQLYNQQYWWRLVNTLQESFPLVVRLFGFKEFNEKIAVPYLVKYPPNTWSLNNLGNRLPQWVEEDYQEKDKQLIIDAAALDCGYYEAFFAAQWPGVNLSKLPNPGDISGLLDKTLYLQPGMALFELNYDLFNFRYEMVRQDVEYWEDNDFPKIDSEKKFYFILYRNTKNLISWKEISFTAYKILQLFKNGSTVDNVCEWIEKQDDTVCEEASANLQKWFQDWIVWHWLCVPNGK